ncbi:MAG TPA: hypothetical protein VMH87_16590, partial [Pseudomonadales bacterium]|nr:hypothetical protein [Pseudomonadales bacterium]
DLGPNMPIPPQYTDYDQNLGLLYGGGILANPSAIFCPLLENPLLQPGQYSTPRFMSSDTTPCVRSPYMFNPRVISAGLPGEPAYNQQRKYNKTSDAKQLDVLELDYIDANTGSSVDGSSPTAGVAFNTQNWAQWPSPGIEAAFTDGSVKYCNLNVAGPPSLGGLTWMQAIIKGLDGNEDTTSFQQYDQIFTVCQYSK